jgi:hypothetical protein
MAQMGQNAAALAAGASGGAWQQKPPVCAKVNELISDLREDKYLAVRMDEFVRWLNKRMQLEAEERGEVAVKASAEDVKECIRYDTTVKVVKTKDAEVLWLWEAWYYYELIDKIADMARRYRSIIADPESDEYDDDCGMLGCDKGDDDAQMEYLEG